MLLSELNPLCELCKFGDEGTCYSPKRLWKLQDCCKEATHEGCSYHCSDRSEAEGDFRKLKGAENTLAKYEEAGRCWNLDNSTRDDFNQNKTTSVDIHTMSNHQSNTNSKDRVIKFYKFCGKGNKIKQ